MISAASAKSGVGEEETQQSVLGPVPVVAVGSVGLGKKGTVSAVHGLDVGDLRIGEEVVSALGCDAQKGIVHGMKDQRGHGDPIDDTGRCSAVVVVVRAAKAGVERGDAIVELAQGANAIGAIRIVGTRKERGLAAEAAKQSAQELDLVETVIGSCSASAEGPRSTAGETPMTERKLQWCQCAQLARQLQDQIAAHGIADERDGAKAMTVDEEAQDGEDVAGQTGVVEGGGERLGAAAVAHVHANDVAAGSARVCWSCRGRTASLDEPSRPWTMMAVGRVARTVFGLPVAVAADLACDLSVSSRRYLDERGLSGRETVDARQEVSRDGLDVAIAEKSSRQKICSVRRYGFKGLPAISAGLACATARGQEARRR